MNASMFLASEIEIGAVHVLSSRNPPQMTRDEPEMEIDLGIPLQSKVMLKIPRMEKDHHRNDPQGKLSCF